MTLYLRHFLSRRHKESNHSTMTDKNDDDNTSDVELEGMDVEDDDEEEATDDDLEDEVPNVPPSPAVDTKLQEAELRDLEAARRERMELIAAESKKIQINKQDRLAYLMAQSDVFAHFLAGT